MMGICLIGVCAQQMFGLFVGASIATVVIIAVAVGQVINERKDGK